MVPNSQTPEWATGNPALAGLKLPRTGSFDQVGLLVTKSLLFAGEGSGLYRAGGGGNQFYAYDKATGAIVYQMTLPANQSGVPMTYAVYGRQLPGRSNRRQGPSRRAYRAVLALVLALVCTLTAER